MVIYSCELCGFNTKHTTNYEKHCLTRKHLRNLEKAEKEKTMVSNPKCKHNVNTTSTQCQHNVNTQNGETSVRTYDCGLCGMSFTTRQSRCRHEKKYCEILKLIDKDDKFRKLEEEIEKLKSQQSNTTNNININTTNYIKNDKVLNYLNSNYGDAIEMDIFINKLKNDTFLSREMMDCFLTCYNNGGVDSFGTTLVKYLNQICKQLDINIFPLCCSDSNLRSHKEKNSVGWETVIDTTKIEEIVNQIVTDIFLETDTMIPLDARERKKICNIVKKSYGLSSIKMLDELEDSSEIYIPLDA